MVLLAAFDAVRIAFWLSSRRLVTVRTERKKSFLGKWARRIGAFVVASAVALNVLSVNALLIAISLGKNSLPVKAAVESPVLDVPDFSKMQAAAEAAIRDLPSAYLSSNQKERLAATLLQLVHTRSPSGEEEDVRAILKTMLEGLQARETECSPGPASDAPLNLVMEIPSTPGYEHEQAVILNAHMDTISLDQCRPEGLVLDGDRKVLSHAQGMSFGADDKAGVMVVVESLRALKENYWDKGYGHRRIVVIITAREEEKLKGASYLTRNYRSIFADALISLTLDFDLERWATDAGRPFVVAVPREKEKDLKYKMILDAVERLGKQRGIPVVRAYELVLIKVDSAAFPPEAFREMYLCAPYVGWHSNERVYLADLVNYTDLLAHVVYTLDAEIQVDPTR
jgi:putative aminopeptidase FrvX